MGRSIPRRHVLAGLAMTVLAPAARAAPFFAQPPCLLVAGPAGGALDRWADLIAPALGRSMLGGGALDRDAVGGVDGVTGVNQFDARTNPDGATALLLPGAALMAWLVGDARVRFDAGAWAPLWGGSTGAVVVTRAPLVAGQAVRLAVADIAGPPLEALLALHMMGMEPVLLPITGENPLQRTDLDAVYLRGAPPRDKLSALGWRPAFTLPAQGTDGAARNPAFAEIPVATALFAPARQADGTMAAVFRAVSAAASLEFALVMPAVAPAAVLAWWRRGCDQLDDAPALQRAAAAVDVRQDDAGAIATQLADISLDTTEMLALRTLLAERYHFRPS